MINLATDIQSLTDFKRKTNQFMKQMQGSGNPVVLTVNGKAALVVQDAAAYQRLLEVVERAEAITGIRRGLEQMHNGEGRPAAEFFAEMKKKYGIGDE
jgi:prevent-host-death family protein